MDCFLTSAQVSLYICTHTLGKERKRKDCTLQRHFNEASLYIFTRTFGTERKRKDYTFQSQLNEKPVITPGCPGYSDL